MTLRLQVLAHEIAMERSYRIASQWYDKTYHGSTPDGTGTMKT